MLVEPEVGEDPPRRRLRLGGGHRQPDPCRPQFGKQRGDAVEQPVHRPAAGHVVRPVRGDRGVGVLAEAHITHLVMHRGADDHSCQVAVGHHGADESSAWRKLDTMP